MRLTKLTVYDVNAWLEKSGYKDEDGNPYRVHGVRGLVALVNGDSGKGTLVINPEGISEIVEPMEKLEIYVSPEHSNGSVAIFPTATLKVSLAEMRKSCPRVEPVYVADFIRKFGARLESNFTSVLRHMRDIGVDPSHYHAGFSR